MSVQPPAGAPSRDSAYPTTPPGVFFGSKAREFEFPVAPARVVFGEGSSRKVGEEVARAGFSRPMVISTPGRCAETRLQEALGPIAVAYFLQARVHVPVDTIARARQCATEHHADCTVTLGGGSAVGLGKALARELGLAQIAIPTTYAGSEMTCIWGMTDAGIKRTGRDPVVLPKTVLYDPTLLQTLSAPQRVASGLNAMAHCAEALYGPTANPMSSLYAERGMSALGHSLQALFQQPDDPDLHAHALFGASLAGLALGNGGMGLHHKLCHVLGGAFDLPHAELHALLLPFVLRFNEAFAPRAMERMSYALHAVDPALFLHNLARRAALPESLAALGLEPSDLDHAADLATHVPIEHPGLASRAAVRELLQHAWAGELSERHAPGKTHPADDGGGAMPGDAADDS